MKKRKILQMLRELLRDAIHTQTQPDDASGLGTRYFVDQEQLMKNIEYELEQTAPHDPYCTCEDCDYIREH